MDGQDGCVTGGGCIADDASGARSGDPHENAQVVFSSNIAVSSAPSEYPTVGRRGAAALPRRHLRRPARAGVFGGLSLLWACGASGALPLAAGAPMVTPGAAEMAAQRTAQEQKLHQESWDLWSKCTALCQAAGKKRVAVKGAEGRGYSIDCQGGVGNDGTTGGGTPRNGGVLRVFDKHGVAVFGVQACDYQAIKRQRSTSLWAEPRALPLWIQKQSASKYRLEFFYPKMSSKKAHALVTWGT